MIKANEARRITKDFIVNEYLDKIVESHIITRAEYGYNEASFYYPKEPIDIAIVLSLLSENGYEVSSLVNENDEEYGYKVKWQ